MKRNRIRLFFKVLIISSGFFVGFYLKNKGYKLTMPKYRKWELSRDTIPVKIDIPMTIEEINDMVLPAAINAS